MTTTRQELINQANVIRNETIAGANTAQRVGDMFIDDLRSTKRDNHILVEDLADFPDPVNGVITLENETAYELNGLIDVGTNEITYGTGSAVYGFGNQDGIFYTGTGTAVTSVNNEIRLQRMLILAPNGQGVDLTGTAEQLCVFHLVGLVGCQTIGEIKGFDTIGINLSRLAGTPSSRTPNGLTISSTVTNHFLMSSCFLAYFADGAYMIDLNSDLDITGISIHGNVFDDGSTAYAIRQQVGATINEQALLTNNNFFQGSNITSGFGPESPKWVVKNNIGLADSIAKINYYESTTTETVISAINTPTKIAGTTSVVPGNQRFIQDQNNRATYTGIRPTTVNIFASVSISSSSNNVLYDVFIVKNGTLIEGSDTQIRIDAAGDILSGVSNGTTPIENGDYIEVWIQNQTSSANVTAESLSVIITE